MQLAGGGGAVEYWVTTGLGGQLVVVGITAPSWGRRCAVCSPNMLNRSDPGRGNDGEDGTFSLSGGDSGVGLESLGLFGGVGAGVRRDSMYELMSDASVESGVGVTTPVEVTLLVTWRVLIG